MREPTITLMPDGPVPAYKQVVDQMRLLIQTGMLEAEETLPPVRALAAQLGIHHNTVAEAYRALAGEGLIDLSHGRRARVCAAAPNRVLSAAERRDLRTRLKALVAELRSKGIAEAEILQDIHAVLGR